MKKSVGFLALGLVVGFVGIGCSSSSDGGGGGGSGDTPDFNSISNEFNSPSGSLSETSAGGAVSGYGDASKSSTSMGSVLAMSEDVPSGRLQTMSVHTLDGQFMTTCSKKLNDEMQQKARAQQTNSSGNSAQFSASISGCDCGGGGTVNMSVSVSAQKQSNGQTTGSVVYKTELNKCQAKDATVSGKMYFSAVVSSEAASSKAYFNGALVYVGDLTVTGGANPGRYEAKFAMKGGKTFHIVKVPDGTVSVAAEGDWKGATKTGTLTVVAKNGTWTCKLTDGKGTCTSDTGQSFQVKG